MIGIPFHSAAGSPSGICSPVVSGVSEGACVAVDSDVAVAGTVGVKVGIGVGVGGIVLMIVAVGIEVGVGFRLEKVQPNIRNRIMHNTGMLVFRFIIPPSYWIFLPLQKAFGNSKKNL
jgi:hypothetical protein